jgi:hypothetical protein
MTFGGIGANGLATNIETRKRISKSLSGRTLSESLKKRSQSQKSAFADTWNHWRKKAKMRLNATFLSKWGSDTHYPHGIALFSVDNSVKAP